jgi:hypothetical protein
LYAGSLAKMLVISLTKGSKNLKDAILQVSKPVIQPFQQQQQNPSKADDTDGQHIQDQDVQNNDLILDKEFVEALRSQCPKLQLLKVTGMCVEQEALSAISSPDNNTWMESLMTLEVRLTKSVHRLTYTKGIDNISISAKASPTSPLSFTPLFSNY